MLTIALATAMLTLGQAPPYAPGERMAFGISYLGMRLGTAAVSVDPSEGALVPVELEAHTTGVASSVYAFRERLRTTVDPDTGLPAVEVVEAKEQGRHHLDTTRFDRETSRAMLIERGKKTRTVELEITPDTLDFMALVFQLRRLPLAPGDRHTFQVLSGDKLREVVVEVVGRETLETDAGTFPCVKVQVPTGFAGKFHEQNPTLLWFGDDPRHVLVRLSIDFSIGRAVADLTSYQPGTETAGGTARRSAP